MAETALTDKKERFCREYVIDYNQTKAAIRAGYAEKSAAKKGCELMKEPEVKAYVPADKWLLQNINARMDEVEKELKEGGV